MYDVDFDFREMEETVDKYGLDCSFPGLGDYAPI